jgi:hypothetical protein
MGASATLDDAGKGAGGGSLIKDLLMDLFGG